MRVTGHVARRQPTNTPISSIRFDYMILGPFESRYVVDLSLVDPSAFFDGFGLGVRGHNRGFSPHPSAHERYCITHLEVIIGVLLCHEQRNHIYSYLISDAPYYVPGFPKMVTWKLVVVVFLIIGVPTIPVLICLFYNFLKKGESVANRAAHFRPQQATLPVQQAGPSTGYPAGYPAGPTPFSTSGKVTEHPTMQPVDPSKPSGKPVTNLTAQPEAPHGEDGPFAPTGGFKNPGLVYV